MKTLAVIVTTPPQANLTTTAIGFIKQSYKANIKIVGVFFYQDGVYNAANNCQFASDEYQTTQQWQVLHQQLNIPLHLCATAAEKRGLLAQQGDENSLINREFIISGLGELVELTNQADKVVQL